MPIQRPEEPGRPADAAPAAATAAAPSLPEGWSDGAEAVLGALTDPALVYDARMNVARANRAFLATLGFDPRGLHVREVMQRVSCRAPDGSPLQLEGQPTPRALRGEAVTGVRFLVTRADGTDMAVEVAASAIQAGGRIAGSLTIWHDVTDRLRAEEALRASERRYRDLVQVSPEAILVNRGDRIVLANPAAAALFGARGPEALLGRSALQLFDPAYHDVIRQRVRAVMDGIAVPPLEERIVRLDGTVRDVEVLAVPLDDEAGRAVQVILRDVSERKRAEDELRASEQRANAILGSLLEGVVLLDTQGAVVQINEAGRALLGLDLEDLTDPARDPRRRIVRSDGSPFPVEEQPAMVALRTGRGVQDVEMGIPGRDGSLRWMAVSARPLRDVAGRVVGAVASFFDVTERRRNEEALRESVRRRTDFLAVLSHELRNPLAAMSSGLYLLDRSPPGSPRAVLAKEAIGRQVTHLAKLVDDLLDVNRIDQGKVRLERSRFDARTVVERACQDVHPVCTEREIALGVEVGPVPLWVDADATRLAQIVGNLLHNAAKFTPAGGRVAVALLGRDGGAELRVRDTGAGIEPEMLERIFEPFVQAGRTREAARGGLGIGLALVKSLVALHGGTVRASSEGPGRGSEFLVTLPLAPPPQVEGAKRRAVAVPPLSVLIVEDNADAGLTLAGLLQAEGHRARVVTDGLSGVTAFAEGRPDLLFCDVGLPDMSGYEVLEQVRRLPGGKTVHAVALTGFAQPDDLRKAVAAGFDAHLAKPLAMDQLDEVLLAASRSRTAPVPSAGPPSGTTAPRGAGAARQPHGRSAPRAGVRAGPRRPSKPGPGRGR
jgi:PAS domain S-box-containing protein